ncbi:ABC transporter ATP-binding protein [Paenochrobactrum glaciei]|uniref:ABC transporter ATP-binding protein n=1 Tax=Paenochrobactrum glaciei TaxID=486407 RepID=A0ABN1GPR5_9HYPH
MNLSDKPLVSVRDLSVSIGEVPILDGVSIDIYQGEILAVMGESGAGKSMVAMSIMGILPPLGKITGGEIFFREKNLLATSENSRRELRGTSMAMVHQDAPTALNPVYTVGYQIAEMFRARLGMGRKAAQEKAVELIRKVGLPNPEERSKYYPHQLSGGMRQRIMIAMAIALQPDFLIADEPTTALDVTVQAQILDLLAKLQQENQMGVMLVTHDFGVVAEIANRVAILYAGRVIETGKPDEIFTRAAHPYALALAACVPDLDLEDQALPSISGRPASLVDSIKGCAFSPRCPFSQDICNSERPLLKVVAQGRQAACHFSEKLMTSDNAARAFI